MRNEGTILISAAFLILVITTALAADVDIGLRVYDTTTTTPIAIAVQPTATPSPYPSPIASVSKLRVISKQDNNQYGVKLVPADDPTRTNFAVNLNVLPLPSSSPTTLYMKQYDTTAPTCTITRPSDIGAQYSDYSVNGTEVFTFSCCANSVAGACKASNGGALAPKRNSDGFTYSTSPQVQCALTYVANQLDVQVPNPVWTPCSGLTSATHLRTTAVPSPTPSPTSTAAYSSYTYLHGAHSVTSSLEGTYTFYVRAFNTNDLASNQPVGYAATTWRTDLQIPLVWITSKNVNTTQPAFSFQSSDTASGDNTFFCEVDYDSFGATLYPKTQCGTGNTGSFQLPAAYAPYITNARGYTFKVWANDNVGHQSVLTAANATPSTNVSYWVNGGWSGWYTVTYSCASCGVGQWQVRRYCNSPAPYNGGIDCPGAWPGEYQDTYWNYPYCATNGYWTGSGGYWGGCNTTTTYAHYYCAYVAPTCGGSDVADNCSYDAQCCTPNAYWTYGPCDDNGYSGYRTCSGSCGTCDDGTGISGTEYGTYSAGSCCCNANQYCGSQAPIQSSICGARYKCSQGLAGRGGILTTGSICDKGSWNYGVCNHCQGGSGYFDSNFDTSGGDCPGYGGAWRCY